jgi:hypothetical protein
MTPEQMNNKMEFLLEQQASLTAQVQMLAQSTAQIAQATGQNSTDIAKLVQAQNETRVRMEAGFEETRERMEAGFEETRFALNKLMDVVENVRDHSINLEKRVKKLEEN